MTKSGLPKSIRRRIRFEKARIRRDVSDPYKQRQAIASIYLGFHAKPPKSV